jgi:hypothetical protein
MATPTRQMRRLPFAHRDEVAGVNNAILERVGRSAQTLRESMLSPSNTQRLKHGRHWQTTYADSPEDISEMQVHSTEFKINLQHIVDHDVSRLAHYLRTLPNEMHKSFLLSMYQLVEETSERAGNVINEKDFKTGFMEALSGIKFGVDEFGVPSMPEFHGGRAMMEKVEMAARERDPEYDEKIKQIIERKKSEAIADEARRIARYKWR